MGLLVISLCLPTHENLAAERVAINKAAQAAVHLMSPNCIARAFCPPEPVLSPAAPEQWIFFFAFAVQGALTLHLCMAPAGVGLHAARGAVHLKADVVQGHNPPTLRHDIKQHSTGCSCLTVAGQLTVTGPV